MAEISNNRRTSSFSTGKIFNAKELFIIVPTIPDETLKATAPRLLPVLMLLIYNGGRARIVKSRLLSGAISNAKILTILTIFHDRR